MATENTGPDTAINTDIDAEKEKPSVDTDDTEDGFAVAGVNLFDESTKINPWSFSIGGDGASIEQKTELKKKIDAGTATKAEMDAYSTLSTYDDRGYKGYRYGYIIGRLVPTEEMVNITELSIAQHTPTGWRLTHGAAQMMFSKGWDFVKSVKKKEPLKPKYLYNALVDADTEFKFKKYFIVAEEKARALHKCLFIKWQLSQPGKRRQYIPRVALIMESEIDYNDFGDPVRFNPFLKVGKTWKQFHFSPKEAFLWIFNEDPLGNRYQGRSILIPVYWTIRRMENMIDAYLLVILMRGLGRLILKINKVQTPAQAETWANKFKKLAQRHILVVGKDFEYKVEEGIKQGYDFPTTLKTCINQVATGTGFPAAHLSGDSNGVLASAKTGQDTTGGQVKADQQDTEDNMTKAYNLFVPMTQAHEWEYDWKYQIEHDEVEKANIVARKVATAHEMGFLPTGFVFQYLDQELPAGTDPEMPFIHFLSKVTQENPYMPEDEWEEEEGLEEEGQQEKKEEKKPPMEKKEGAKESQVTKAEIKKPAMTNAGQEKRSMETPKKKGDENTGDNPDDMQDKESLGLIVNKDNLPPGFVMSKDGSIPLPPKHVFMGICRHVLGRGTKNTALVMRELYPDGVAMDNNTIQKVERRNVFRNIEKQLKKSEENEK